MDLVYNLLLILHLLGMAALVGGWLVFARGADAVEVMVWGARAQVLTGVVLTGLASAVDSLDKSPNNAQIGLKLVIAIAAVGCIEVARGRAKRGQDAKGLVQAAGALGVANVIVAAGWN
jgi:hypothetical protein